MKTSPLCRPAQMELLRISSIRNTLFLAALFIAFFSPPAISARALPVARLRNVKPTVNVRVSSAKNFVAVKEKRAINFGDIIRTEKNGKAEVLFSNGTRVAMNGGSQIQVVAPESKTSPLVIRVFGALSEVFVRPRGNTQIKTAAAIAAARGTAFLVRLPDENTAVVTVTEDEVDFFNSQGRVLVAAGQQSSAVVGSAPTPPIATDASGELAWTAEVSGLPVEYETSLSAFDDAAIARMENAATQNPNDVKSQVQLGDLRRAQGNAAEAKNAYERALQLDANAADARVGLALTALSLGDFAGAREALQPVAEYSGAQTILGLVDLQQGNYAQATQQFQNAIASNPLEYQAHSLLALTLLTQNQIEAAQKSARAAVEIQPTSAQAQSTLAMVLFFSPEKFQDEASRAAKRAFELNPNSPLALLVQGRVLLAQREPDEAAQMFAQAAALMPRLEIAQRELGAAMLRQGKPQSAEKAYRRALAVNPDSAEAQSGLGVALLRQGQAKAARIAQERALQLDAANSTVRVNFASLLIQEGKLNEARVQLEQGIIAAPTRGLLYAQLSELSLFQQRLVDALDFARKGTGLLPNSALTHYQLGRVYLELDRGVQALQEFRKAVLLDRDFPEARYALGFAQELVETGRDPSRPAAAAGAGAINSAARALNIQNLQTPGAEHRIQAAIQDATVIRTASRSFGDTEAEIIVGENGTLNGDVSHLQLDGGRRVLGVTAERRSFDDINGRENSDLTSDRFGLIFGQKAKNNPSSFLAMGQYDRIVEGLNKGDQPSITESVRTRVTKPRLLLGGNWQTSDHSRTRALIQYVRPETNSVNPLFGDWQNSQNKSFNAELRHDLRLGTANYISAGVFAGKRSRAIKLFLAGFPPFFPDQESLNNIDLTVYGAYIRDEFEVSEKLRLIGELKGMHFKGVSSFEIFGLSSISRPQAELASSNFLPTFIAEYRPNFHTEVRLRARRLAGGIRDFELLSPTDTFLSPLNDLPSLSAVGKGVSFELEGDHTFRNGSFLRLGIFQQNLKDAREVTVDDSGAVLPRVRSRGVRAGYEGLLSRDVSYYLNGTLNSVRDQSGNQVANVPHWSAEAGLQYLNQEGWFAQPSYFYQSSRERSDGRAAHSFGVLNLRAGKRFGLRGTAFVEMRNITNAHYDILEIEQPNRQLRVGILGRF